MPLILLPCLLPFISAEGSKITWKPLFEFRTRYERRLNKDFNDAKSDNRVDYFTRLRIGTSFAVGKDWTGRFVYQYAQAIHQTPNLNNSEDRSDLLELNLSIPISLGKLTVGRQQFTKGDHRLFDEGAFGLTGTYLDLVKLQGKDFDLFGGTVPIQSKPNRAARVLGASQLWRAGESMAIYTHSGDGTGKRDLYTFDHLYRKPLKSAELTLELIGQLGRYGHQKVEAFAGVARWNRTLSPTWKTFVEGNLSSGGSSGSTRHTFDPLFGSFHKYYGIMDVVSFSNLQELAGGFSYLPRKDINLSLEYHRFGLHDATDAVYTNGVTPLKSGSKTLVDPTGHSGTDLGQEISLEATWSFQKQWSLSGGAGIFRPGNFVRSLVGSQVADQTWGYVQLQCKF